MRLDRREFMRIAALAGATVMTPGWARRSWAEVLATGLSDPALQPKFAYPVPNALHPAFRYWPDVKGRYKIALRQGTHRSGLVDAAGRQLSTPIFGYGDERGPTWPGRTFEVKSAAQADSRRPRSGGRTRSRAARTCSRSTPRSIGPTASMATSTIRSGPAASRS